MVTVASEPTTPAVPELVSSRTSSSSRKKPPSVRSDTSIALILVFQFQEAVAHVNFEVGLSGLLVDVASQVGLTHDNGADGTAYSEKTHEILEMASWN